MILYGQVDTLDITFPCRLGGEWEDPVHTGMLSESQELLPDEDEEDNNEESDKEPRDAEPVKAQEDAPHKGRYLLLYWSRQIYNAFTPIMVQHYSVL